MDLRQLTTLVAIADHGSFSAAARALYTVQSNVSGHIARLERELGVTLVDRQRGGLTDEGAIVVERARRVLHELDDGSLYPAAAARPHAARPAGGAHHDPRGQHHQPAAPAGVTAPRRGAHPPPGRRSGARRRAPVRRRGRGAGPLLAPVRRRRRDHARRGGPTPPAPAAT